MRLLVALIQGAEFGESRVQCGRVEEHGAAKTVFGCSLAGTIFCSLARYLAAVWLFLAVFGPLSPLSAFLACSLAPLFLQSGSFLLQSGFF